MYADVCIMNKINKYYYYAIIILVQNALCQDLMVIISVCSLVINWHHICFDKMYDLVT